jgi:hypothetical protein
MSKKTFPEEKIRQSLLVFMQESLRYPKEMIAVEKALSAFPHLKGKKLPNRRFDIAVFGTKDVCPLLIVECKAIPLNQKAFDQVIGYNHLINAPFLALANQTEVITLIKEGGMYHKVSGLPDYEVLLKGYDGIK